MTNAAANTLPTMYCLYHFLNEYLLRRAWLMVLILLAIPPSLMLLASASSSADCVTEASVVQY